MTDAERTLLLLCAAQIRELVMNQHPLSRSVTVRAIDDLMEKVYDEATAE